MHDRHSSVRSRSRGTDRQVQGSTWSRLKIINEYAGVLNQGQLSYPLHPQSCQRRRSWLYVGGMVGSTFGVKGGAEARDRSAVTLANVYLYGSRTSHVLDDPKYIREPNAWSRSIQASRRSKLWWVPERNRCQTLNGGMNRPTAGINCQRSKTGKYVGCLNCEKDFCNLFGIWANKCRSGTDQHRYRYRISR